MNYDMMTLIEWNKPPLKRGTRGINYLMRYKGKGCDRCTHFKWWFVVGCLLVHNYAVCG